MPRRLFVFDLPERFATGTVGEPGNRTFFLQARDGRRVVSVGLEKAQVAVLADRLGKLVDLARVGRAGAVRGELLLGHRRRQHQGLSGL